MKMLYVLLDSVLRNVLASVRGSDQDMNRARCYNGPEEASVSRPCVLDNDQCCVSQKHSKLKQIVEPLPQIKLAHNVFEKHSPDLKGLRLFRCGIGNFYIHRFSSRHIVLHCNIENVCSSLEHFERKDLNYRHYIVHYKVQKRESHSAYPVSNTSRPLLK